MYEYRNYIIRTTFCPFRTVTKSCPVETVPACPVQIRAHRHIAVYIDSNNIDVLKVVFFIVRYRSILSTQSQVEAFVLILVINKKRKKEKSMLLKELYMFTCLNKL